MTKTAWDRKGDRGSAGRSFGGNVSERSNVIAFPLNFRAGAAAAEASPYAKPRFYEFTEDELAALCRWFSAMKYAFPATEGVMIVSHQDNYSAVGLYNPDGGAPNCLVAKHEVSGFARFFWSTGKCSSGEGSNRHVLSATVGPAPSGK